MEQLTFEGNKTLSVVKTKGVMTLSGIDSKQILDALSQKHKDDVFIPECKNGETWGARDLLKLDAWVLKRTYSPLTTIGYEIKVSRSDFENDQKWTGYLDLCNEFFFACPAGLIRATDVPSSVGIIWISQSGKLHVKRKAEYRTPDIEKQNRLLIYALMARSKIVSDRVNGEQETPIDRVHNHLAFLKEQTEKAELAYFVKSHIRKLSDTLQKKEIELGYRESYVKDFEKRLALLGITWDSTNANWHDNNQVGNDINNLKSRIDDFTLRDMKSIGQKLIDTAETILKLHNPMG